MADYNTPEWWLERLYSKLSERENKFELLESYTEGEAPLPEGAEGFRDAYRSFQAKARTNFAEIIIEAVQERMTVTGFRIGNDPALDEAAARIWSVNEMDAQSTDVHGDMLTYGEGYVIVGPPEVRSTWDWLPWRRGERIPVITWEEPEHVVCEHDPLSPSRVVAAIKQTENEIEDTELVYLYLPGIVYVYARKYNKATEYFTVRGFELTQTINLPEKVVPVVHFRNRRDMGEFETHTDLLDRINYMVLQRLVIAAMQAYRQRALKGEMPETDEDGNPIDYGALFKAGPGAIWNLPEGVDLWESAYTDINPLITAVKQDIVMLAANTRTPLPMLMPDSQTQSAEGAVAAREGLVYKANDRIKRASYGWNQVMQLALLFGGYGLQRDVETLWLPAERQSLAERADAASKAADLPFGTKLRKIWGFSETEADRIEQERMQDVLTQNLGTAPTPTQRMNG